MPGDASQPSLSTRARPGNLARHKTNRTHRVGDDEAAGQMVCFQGSGQNLLDVRTQKYACTAHVGAKRPCTAVLHRRVREWYTLNATTQVVTT